MAANTGGRASALVAAQYRQLVMEADLSGEAGTTGGGDAAAAARPRQARASGRPEGLPLVDVAGAEPLSAEGFRANVNSSWRLNFDGEGYFRDAWLMLRENVGTFVLAMVIWGVTLAVIEAFFWYAFGRLTVHGSHHVDSAGLHYTHDGRVVPFGRWRSESRGHTTEFYVLHVAVLYVHRVFLFYPAIASFYAAAFNGMRHAGGRVALGDFFTCFRIDWLLRLWPASSVLFALAFVTTLQWYLVPLFLYSTILTLFVLPMLVDNPGMSTRDALVNSAIVSNGHLVSVTVFFVFCFLLQVVGLFLIVGVFVTFPLCHLAVCYMVHHLIGVRGVDRGLEPMPVE